MIEEPALVTIETRPRGPGKADIQTLSRFPTGFLADAMDGRGALAPEIKNVHTDLPAKFTGQALTCQCGPGDVLGLLAALSELRPGDVLVMATDGWRGCAAAGDRVMGMAKNSGAVGFVTDGLVRDITGIVDVGIGVFATGISPNSPFAKGPGTVGSAVVLGNVSVQTGDVIVADSDGVVVVPRADVKRVIEAVKHIEVLETELDKEVAAGLKLPENIVALLNSEQVKRL